MMHDSAIPLTRREMLSRSATGFGALALTALLAEDAPSQSGRPGVLTGRVGGAGSLER